MIHNTYRRLDESSLQLGPLTLPQWLLIALIAAAVYGLKALTGLATQPALCIATVAIGAPFSAMALSEGGRPSYLRLLRDALLWTARPKHLTAGGGAPRPLTLKLQTTRERPPKADRSPAAAVQHQPGAPQSENSQSVSSTPPPDRDVEDLAWLLAEEGDEDWAS